MQISDQEGIPVTSQHDGDIVSKTEKVYQFQYLFMSL